MILRLGVVVKVVVSEDVDGSVSLDLLLPHLDSRGWGDGVED